MNLNQQHINHDELKVHTFQLDKERLQEANNSSSSNGELNNSKISLFTHEEEEPKHKVYNDDELDQKLQLGVQLITESNYDSNNYNYSESEFNHQNGGGTNSIGAILQCFGNGSFVGSNKNNA